MNVHLAVADKIFFILPLKQSTSYQNILAFLQLHLEFATLAFSGFFAFGAIDAVEMAR